MKEAIPIAVAIAASSLLMSCATQISYKTWNPQSDTLSSKELRFILQDSAVTLAVPASKPANGGDTTDSGPQPNCKPSPPDKTNWNECFNAVKVTSAPAPPPDGTNVYLAVPGDASHVGATSTAIAGAAVAGQDYLYSSVTISYTDNTAKILASAASGAATGFSVGGVYGAGVGFGLGAAASALGVSTQPLPSDWTDYLCEPRGTNDPKYDLGSLASAKLVPALSLPLTFTGADARPFETASEAQSTATYTSNVTRLKDNSFPLVNCWHLLPNAANTSNATLSDVSHDIDSAQRPPQAGDGWLYRVVLAADENPNSPPAGAVSAAEYFGTGKHRSNGHDFPYSACRKVVVEITWWETLADALTAARADKNKNPPIVKAVLFPTVMADPNFVIAADIKKGGTITFKNTCGASVSLSPAAANLAADVNAAVSATQSIYNAEQSWEKTQTTK